MEIRTYQGPGKPVIRMEGDTSTEGRVIEGYAIVFNVPSNVLCEGYGSFIETIDRGALTEEKLRQWDIRALLEHNAERLLARWRQGVGTLQLSLDATGLRYRFQAPDTVDGNTAVELIRRGDIIGSSFAYLCDERSVKWGKAEDGIPTRLVTDITYMEDISVVSRPAYDQTSVTCRFLTQLPADQDEQAKRKMQAQYIAEQRKETEKVTNFKL